MSADKEIKPAEIQDDDLDGAQGGLRALPTTGVRTTGIRATDVKLDRFGMTVDADLSRDQLTDYDESGPGIVHKTR